MLGTFSPLAKLVKYKEQSISISNCIFFCNCKVTLVFIWTACALLCLHEYFGEQISCIVGDIDVKFTERYCYIKPTFTVVKHFNSSAVNQGIQPHFGVGPYNRYEDEIIYHNYYLWSPFVLFILGTVAYAPWYLWKFWEGGRMKSLVSVLSYGYLSLLEEEVKLNHFTIPSKMQREENMKLVRDDFIQRLQLNKSWTRDYLFCEALNVIVLGLQIYFVHIFLGHRFLTLGIDYLQGKDITLDGVFPKVTKCDFNKYGPSGTIQFHDVMCVMSLNVVNEKIYTFLWFWYTFLCVLTLAGLVWRVLTFFFHSRSLWFNKLVFGCANPNSVDVWDLLETTRECHFSDWLFLSFLAGNVDGLLFRKLFLSAAHELSG